MYIYPNREEESIFQCRNWCPYIYIYIRDDTLLIFQQCYRTGKQMILLTTVKCNFNISHNQPLAPHA